MFRNLFAQKPSQGISPRRSPSPFKANRTPVKIQRQTGQRSPIRNRPSDIKNLKSFLYTFVPKPNTSPMRLKSPLKIETAYEIPVDVGRGGRDPSPRRTTIKQETRYVSPSRISNKNTYQFTDFRKGGETWRAPSEIIGNHPQSNLSKENSKLFTNLLKNIKSQGDDSQHTEEYNRRRIEVEATNAALKRPTSLFQQFNRVESQIHFQTETKIKEIGNHIQIEQKSIVEFKDLDVENVEHSFGIPFIESITPSKHRGTCDQPMDLTLKPMVVESLKPQFMWEKEERRRNESIKQSLSDNDRVVESVTSGEFELNMSLTK